MENMKTIKGRTNLGEKIFRTLVIMSLTCAGITAHLQPVYAEISRVGEGQVQDGIVLNSIDVQTVSSGGTANNTIINAYGQQEIDGGTANDAKLNVSGIQNISNGGKAIGTVITNGTQNINNLGVAENTVVNSGAQNIKDGGTANNTTLNVLAWQLVNAGGKAQTTIINGGAIQSVFGNATATDTTINIGGVQSILGGEALSTTINGGGIQNVNADGIARNTIVKGGTQTINGGVANNTSIENGVQNINADGKAIDTIISENSMQEINIMGEAVGTTINGGVQNVNGGIAANTIINADGVQNVHAKGIAEQSTLVGGIQNVNADGIAKHTTINGGVQNVNDGAQADNTIINADGVQSVFAGGKAQKTTIQSGGSQVIYDGGEANYTVVNDGADQNVFAGGKVRNTTIKTNGVLSIFEGGVQVEGTTIVDGGQFSIWADNFHITGNLKVLNNGYLWLHNLDSTHNNKLYIDNLQGSAIFQIKTDLTNEIGDSINITQADGSINYIEIGDKSLMTNTTVAANKKLLIVTDESGQGTFVGRGLNAGGLWEVTPIIEKDSEQQAQDGNRGTESKWYLTNIEKAVNNDTAVLLDSVDNGYGLWRNTNDSLRNHLGTLAHLAANDQGGMWGRMIGGRLGSSDFSGSYHLYQLGYDKAADAKSIYGFALDKGTGSADYAAGREENDFLSGSVYGVWSADDGSYTNAVARIGQFSNDINSYGDYPDEGSYKNKAYSLSVEYGKTLALNHAAGTFITPEMQLVAGRLGSTNYTTERNSQVRLGGLNSFIGRAGLTLGQKNNQGDELYLKAAVLHEFGGSRNIEMVAENGEILSGARHYSDTWVEVGVGGNVKLGRNTNLYGSVEKTFGADIQKKWQLNAGLRWEF